LSRRGGGNGMGIWHRARPRRQREAIPSSGERCKAIGCGTWQARDGGGAVELRAVSATALRSFFASCGTVIHSSPEYGLAEGDIGE